MGHHFCCCLPLRLGVFLISLVQTIGFGLIAAGAWFIVAIRSEENVGSRFRRVAISFGVFYSFMAILALVGFIGSLRRSANSMKSYAQALAAALVLSLVLDGIYIWAIFTIPHDEVVRRCINGSTDQLLIDACNKISSNNLKISVIVSVILGLLIQLWSLTIVSQYGDKLLEEQAWRSTVAVPSAGGKYSYTTARGSMEEVRAPLTGATHPYPYTDPQNSYGAHAPGLPYDPPHYPPPV